MNLLKGPKSSICPFYGGGPELKKHRGPRTTVTRQQRSPRPIIVICHKVSPRKRELNIPNDYFLFYDLYDSR